MEFPLIFWSVVLWMIAWGVIGGVVTPRVFLRKDMDISNAPLAGAFVGAASGPLGLIPLWHFAPQTTNRWVLLSAVGTVLILVTAFAVADPDNVCVTNGDLVASQITNGLVMGTIYGLMAMGLTLIFSILRVVNFAHGEFYMIGGMMVYYVSAVWLPGTPPVVAVLAACAITFVIGGLFERIFLTPMYDGRVERPIEYAVLVTFGLAFFLQYFVQALAGASPVKARRFFDFPIIRLPSAEDPWLIKTSKANLTLFDTVSISNPRFTAAVIAILVLLVLLFFLYRTWYGKALRAVSQDRQAAAVTGIDPHRMNMLAFALGGMLAGLSGAVLVQAFSWVPQVGMLPALRSFVIVVLGGLGSLPGAFVGGLIVGLVEAAGTGCIPDPQRAASYIPAYGMIILTLTLLLKPTGLFGRKE
ncbi:MAG: branched-chain amino acid ABC transporter permease [Hyphomicrobiales bacterium]|nr:branched-chain amino acid ABC transporter permease [Hyphomicrobiales bacterium]